MPASKRKRLDHARHNHKVCLLLHRESIWDWTVTTAFYAALHYVQFALFPLHITRPDGGTAVYRTFEEFCRLEWEFVPEKRGKHGVLVELVEDHLPFITAECRALKDLCWTARYDDYVISPMRADHAVRCLKAVRDSCLPDSQHESEAS